jgi:hypothetical protein
MDPKNTQHQEQVGPELIIKGREVYSKQGNNRLGWLRDFPQGGGNSGTTSTLEGRELIVKGRQVFDMNDQSKPIGYLTEDYVGGASGFSGKTEQSQVTR